MANIKVVIDKNGTSTLDTAGKYCKRPIDIVTEVKVGEYNIEATDNGDETQDINITDADEGSVLVDTSDADATAADIAFGKTAYVNGEKIIGERTAIEDETCDVTINTIKGSFVGNLWLQYVSPEGITKKLTLPAGSRTVLQVLKHSCILAYGDVYTYISSTEGYVNLDEIEANENFDWDIATTYDYGYSNQCFFLKVDHSGTVNFENTVII